MVRKARAAARLTDPTGRVRREQSQRERSTGEGDRKAGDQKGEGVRFVRERPEQGHGFPL